MLPIVLHHGLLGFARAGPARLGFRYFRGIDQALQRRGYQVLITQVHPTAGIAHRAQELKQSILDQLNGSPQPVVIVAHSLGGLDARYMISRLGMEDRVAALLTISTPHRGSPYADWCLRHLGQRLGGLALMQFLRLNVDALNDLTTDNCLRLNEQLRDAPQVKYFSVSGSRPWHRVPPFAMHSFKVIFDREGENDSLVSVKSSTWANHLGVWPADHWHLINRRLVLEFKDATGDITPFYLRALESLRGYGLDV